MLEENEALIIQHLRHNDHKKRPGDRNILCMPDLRISFLMIISLHYTGKDRDAGVRGLGEATAFHGAISESFLLTRAAFGVNSQVRRTGRVWSVRIVQRN